MTKLERGYSHRYRKVILVTFIIFSILSSNLSYGHGMDNKKILVLNSYHEGYEWTDNIVDSIKSFYKNQDENYIVKMEFMDTKMINDKEYIDMLYNIFFKKYRHIKFDVIIASDDDAYQFLKKYRNTLFSEIPVVLCGLNEWDDFIITESSLFTGTAETLALKETIDLALKLHKNISHVVVTCDETTLGNFMYKKALEISSLYENQLEFHLIQNNKLDSVLEELNKISNEDSIVVQAGMFKNNFQEIVPIAEANKIISDTVNLPIYVLWDIFVGEGVVGGVVKSSYQTGEVAAKQALQILNGESIKNMPFITKSPSTIMINYEKLKDFNIKAKDIPKGSTFINLPSPFIHLSKKLAYFLIVTTCLVLLVINSFLLANIYKRKKIQRELIKEENILKAVLDTTGDGIIVLDEKSRRILYVNQNFIDMWKLPNQILKENDYTKIIDYVKKQFDNPKDFWLKIEEISQNYQEYMDVLEFIDGRVFERSFKSINTNNDLSVKVWTLKDITKKIEFERKLKENIDIYRNFLDVSPDAIFISKGNKIIIANKAGLSLIGEDVAKNLCNFSLEELIEIHKDYKDVAGKKIDRLWKEELTESFSELKIVLYDNRILDIDLVITSFRYQNDMYIASVVRDITERKIAEELQGKIREKNLLLEKATEYDRLKTEFFSTISHELKTPLNIILSGIQLITFRHKDAIQCPNYQTNEKYLSMMRQNSYRLLKLINNLIDITRIDSGYMTMDFKNHDIVNIVEAISLSVADYIEINGLELIFDTEIEEKIMSFDVEKLERVILNLLSNAIKFTDKGGKIEVNIYDRNEYIAISVKDSGICIPLEMQDAIFERFRQVDSSLRRRREGSGIGLSLVKSIVDLHQGKISLKSETGKGSEFIIELPTRLSKENSQKQEEVAATSDTNVERIHIEFSDIYS